MVSLQNLVIVVETLASNGRGVKQTVVYLVYSTQVFLHLNFLFIYLFVLFIYLVRDWPQSDSSFDSLKVPALSEINQIKYEYGFVTRND